MVSTILSRSSNLRLGVGGIGIVQRFITRINHYYYHPKRWFDTQPFDGNHPDRPRVMYDEMTTRGYKEAISALNSLQSNASVLANIQAEASKVNSRNVLDQTSYYLSRIGYQPKDLNRLNVIHISGTKGKGSTAAFCSSILSDLSKGLKPSPKIGLYTSPHLVAVRERIRIDGQPISEEMFAKYFWEVWDRFYDGNLEPLREDISVRPGYFRYLTYLAYHVFISEKVDATILEVGLGGLRDPTNLVPSPIVTGVTPLGLDHQNVLGRSMAEIAGHKGGIFKPGVPAITVHQEYPDAMNVLKARAIESEASSFTVVPIHPILKTIELGLAGDHQRSNASLAVALVQAFLSSPRLPSKLKTYEGKIIDETSLKTFRDDLPSLPREPSPIVPITIESEFTPPMTSLPQEIVSPEILSERFCRALRETRWPGRCQTFRDPKDPDLVWFLDGAHTVESMICCGNWWNEMVRSNNQDQQGGDGKEGKRIRRALIFNCTSGRSGGELLSKLFETIQSSKRHGLKADGQVFEKIIVTSNKTYKNLIKPEQTKDEQGLRERELTFRAEIERSFSESFRGIKGLEVICFRDSIEESVEEILRLKEGRMEVLVTGSLHLVGGTLEVIESKG
ncbi:Mur ligase [Phakopsora pachyrhizi]|nr:Mur ligase [Phakopsora pachyrhizi]